LYNRRVNVVGNDDPAAVGLPTNYQCIHSEKVIFVDETNESTNQAKNGNHGGQEIITTRNGKARERCTMNDCHFTVLLFTAAT
jgi:hypothetical protein